MSSIILGTTRTGWVAATRMASNATGCSATITVTAAE